MTWPSAFICQPLTLGFVSEAAGTSWVTMTGTSLTKMSWSLAYSSFRFVWSSVVAAWSASCAASGFFHWSARWTFRSNATK